MRGLEVYTSTFCNESDFVSDFYSFPNLKLDRGELSSFKVLFLYYLNTEYAILHGHALIIKPEKQHRFSKTVGIDQVRL